MKQIWYLLGLLFTCYGLQGQSFSVSNYEDIDFLQDGRRLSLGTIGGLNSPVLSQVDLNMDGHLDLYLFDRLGKVHLPLIFSPADSSFRISRSLQRQFPQTQYWTRILDFNQDGIPDIMSSSNDPFLDEVRLFIGKYEANQLGFEAFRNDLGKNSLTFKEEGRDRVILVNNLDMPAIHDIDDDGDLDILAFNSVGTYVEYYKNISIDSSLNLSRPQFVLADECWGKFHEDGSGQGVNFSTNPDMCAPGVVSDLPEGRIHNGATLLALDIDQDSVSDLMFGDPASLFVTLLYNWGSKEKAYMRSEETMFPSRQYAKPIRYLPLPQTLNLNGDDLFDLVISPFQTEGEDIQVLDVFHQVDTQVFIRKDPILIPEMLDHGSFSSPAVFDYNNDGWDDLVIGIGSRFDPISKDQSFLVLYENRKTTPPSFELKDTNWLDLRGRAINDLAFTPVFEDLNSDGHPDLLMGSASGKLYFMANTPQAGEDYRFDQLVKGYMDIDVQSSIGSFSDPMIIDLDQDGLKDLLIGVFNGRIKGFINQGTAEQPYFNYDIDDPENIDNWGGINLSASGKTNGNASPDFLKWNDDLFFCFGDESGRLSFYNPNDWQNNAPLKSVYSLHLEDGARIKTCINDFDRDGTLEIIAGNKRGGLTTYQLTGTTSTAPTEQMILEIRPNPVKEEIHFGQSITGEVLIYSSSGQLVSKTAQKNSRNIDASHLTPGVYYLQVESKSQTHCVKFVKL